MIHTDGTPTIASAGASAPRAGLTVRVSGDVRIQYTERQRSWIRDMTSDIGRGRRVEDLLEEHAAGEHVSKHRHACPGCGC